jgi:hypothetical protein
VKQQKHSRPLGIRIVNGIYPATITKPIGIFAYLLVHVQMQVQIVDSGEIDHRLDIDRERGRDILVVGEVEIDVDGIDVSPPKASVDSSQEAMFDYLIGKVLDWQKFSLYPVGKTSYTQVQWSFHDCYTRVQWSFRDCALIIQPPALFYRLRTAYGERVYGERSFESLYELEVADSKRNNKWITVQNNYGINPINPYIDVHKSNKSIHTCT